jgi:hypothetical protein
MLLPFAIQVALCGTFTISEWPRIRSDQIGAVIAAATSLESNGSVTLSIEITESPVIKVALIFFRHSSESLGAVIIAGSWPVATRLITD